MKAFLGSVVCAVAMSGFTATSVGAAAPQAGTAAASDKVLDSRIEQRIHNDSSLKKHNIDVSVDGGVATLTGTVATDSERAKAKQLATIKGIARVDNKIVVDPAAAHTTIGTAGQKTKEARRKGRRQDERRPEQNRRGDHRWLDHHPREVEVRGRGSSERQRY